VPTSGEGWGGTVVCARANGREEGSKMKLSGDRFRRGEKSPWYGRREKKVSGGDHLTSEERETAEAALCWGIGRLAVTPEVAGGRGKGD